LIAIALARIPPKKSQISRALGSEWYPRFTVKWVYYKNPKAHRIENPEQEEEEEKRWILWH